MDVSENFFLDGEDLDTFSILCTLLIFILNALSVLYILWSVTPLIQPNKGIRSRHSSGDLSRLCSQLSPSELKDAFTTPDETGLFPIHWAAINNRSDMIEFMIANGSPLRIKCQNKLFAYGTPLHLAAMNGSIEASSVLLRNCKKTRKNRDASDAKKDERLILDWLKERDNEGQTPLMRSAPPRSKRLDTVRDLLGKNLWSLSGRPAEMALLFINKGADWRETEPINGMNLMHLAVVNDYDDIVNMLLVIDEQIQKIPASLQKKSDELAPANATNARPSFVSINLDTSSQSRKSNATDSTGSERSLLDNEERTRVVIASGMTPLKLAIVYGRVNMIGSLWLKADTNHEVENNSKNTYSDTSRLRRVLLRAYFSNNIELSRLMRALGLKFVLALDLVLLILLWMPAYLNRSDSVDVDTSIRGGVFLMSFCLSMALTFRVTLKNPGYLRRDSVQYHVELKQIVGRRELDVARGGGKQTSDNNCNNNNKEKVVVDEGVRQQSVAQQQVETATAKAKSEPMVKPATSFDELEVEDRVRYLCHKCMCIRKPRSRHCNYCNHCVQDFDHHCIYLGCCVGRGNRLDFLLTMFIVTVTAIYGTVLYVTTMERRDWCEPWHLIGLFWVFKYALIGGVSSFFVLKRASLGVTMYEAIRSRRIRAIFGSNGPPEEINKSHRVYSTLEDSFWRYSPDRFATGDLLARKILHNLKEFSNFTSPIDYFLSIACADSALALLRG